LRINAKPDENRNSTMADASRALESSSDFARGGGPPTPDHDADNASRAGRLEAEQRRLIQWAKENRNLSCSRRLPPVFARGGEHQVYFQKRTGRYVKATLPDRQKGYGIALGSLTHGAMPSEYLDRLSLQNKIFNDDIRLERIVANRANPSSLLHSLLSREPPQPSQRLMS
jgi:hypothetical protein